MPGLVALLLFQPRPTKRGRTQAACLRSSSYFSGRGWYQLRFPGATLKSRSLNSKRPCNNIPPMARCSHRGVLWPFNHVSNIDYQNPGWVWPAPRLLSVWRRHVAANKHRRVKVVDVAMEPVCHVYAKGVQSQHDNCYQYYSPVWIAQATVCPQDVVGTWNSEEDEVKVGDNRMWQ